MKKLLPFFLMCLSVLGFSQISKQKTWIGVNFITIDSISKYPKIIEENPFSVSESNADTGFSKDTVSISKEYNSTIFVFSKRKAIVYNFGENGLEKHSYKYVQNNDTIWIIDQKDTILRGRVFFDTLLSFTFSNGQNTKQANYAPFLLNEKKNRISAKKTEQLLINTKWQAKYSGITSVIEFLPNGVFKQSSWDNPIKWSVVEFQKQPIILIQYEFGKPYMMIVKSVSSKSMFVECQNPDGIGMIEFQRIY